MEDTICAVATSIGVGAISIIRVSGEKTIEIVNSIFSSDIINCDSHVIIYGHIIDENNEIIDEVLLMIMLKPKTYTTEDVIEINCHGGISTTNKILELLLAKGCRLAEPGEFTKRAFLNGRINLLESEAVNELINAKTDAKRKMCLNQLGGNLTKKIDSIRDLLLSLMANIEVNIDYPEYTDNLEITEDLLAEKLQVIACELQHLVNDAQFGKMIKDGINIAIIGRPNVGKSSILNHLLDEQKAIVTDIAGTTRDLVEGIITINGIEVHLIDTAGIHATDDLVEKIGVERSKQAMQTADLVILVLDGTTQLTNEDKELISLIDKQNSLIFINKNDQTNYQQFDLDYELVEGNTVKLDGLDKLKNKLITKLKINDLNKDLTYLSNVRQTDLVSKALEAIKHAQISLKDNVFIDMIETDLKAAYEFLSEVIGDTYEDALIDRLFQDFCVGK